MSLEYGPSSESLQIACEVVASGEGVREVRRRAYLTQNIFKSRFAKFNLTQISQLALDVSNGEG